MQSISYYRAIICNKAYLHASREFVEMMVWLLDTGGLVQFSRFHVSMLWLDKNGAWWVPTYHFLIFYDLALPLNSHCPFHFCSYSALSGPVRLLLDHHIASWITARLLPHQPRLKPFISYGMVWRGTTSLTPKQESGRIYLIQNSQIRRWFARVNCRRVFWGSNWEGEDRWFIVVSMVTLVQHTTTFAIPALNNNRSSWWYVHHSQDVFKPRRSFFRHILNNLRQQWCTTARIMYWIEAAEFAVMVMCVRRMGCIILINEGGRILLCFFLFLIHLGIMISVL